MRVVEGAIGAVMVLLAVITVFWVVVTTNEETRTQEAIDNTLSCTSDASGDCAFNLPTVHEYSDLGWATVTETSPTPGDRTSSSTLGSNRQTITVAALPTTTAHQFSVTYRELDDHVPPAAIGWLKMSGYMWAFALPLAAIAGIYFSARKV